MEENNLEIQPTEPNPIFQIRPRRRPRGRPFAVGNTYRRDGKSGRVKGTPNKFTTLKQSFIEAFKKIGGEKMLVEYAKVDRRNLTNFLRILATMLPKEMNLTVESTQALANNLQMARDRSRPQITQEVVIVQEISKTAEPEKTGEKVAEN